MKSIVSMLAALSVLLVLFGAPSEVHAQEDTNARLLNEISSALTELDALIVAYERGTLEIWPGYTVDIPAALKTQMRARGAALRTKIREKLTALSLD